MQKLIYVPPWRDILDPACGLPIRIGAPYVIGSIRGIGGVETELYTADAPGIPGSPVYGHRLRPRTIVVPLHVSGKNRQEMYALRRELAGYTAPAQSAAWEGLGRLYYYNDAGAYWIPAVPINSPEYTERLRHFNVAEIRFFCPDPAWRGVQRHSVHLSYNQPLFEFPFEFPVEFGMIGHETTITNHGTTATPVEIYIYAKPQHSVTVTNRRTGQFITVNRVLDTDDILYINTDPAAPELSVIHPDGRRDNAARYIDLETDFWQLLPGENIITYEGEEDNHAAEIDLHWYDRYFGL